MLRFITLLTLCTLATLSAASDSVRGEVTRYRSPNGVEERCVAIAPMPGGNYSSEDRDTERRYCAIDFYATDTGLCPKTWSTSPGTMVFDLAGGHYAGHQREFEQDVCAHGFRSEIKAVGEPVGYKLTMNSRQTSATFSTASLLYYHFARYFDAAVHIPVAVYRSMDRREHRRRVTERGLALTAHKHSLQMNHAAWSIVELAEQDPGSYSPTDELFTADRKAIYGVMLHPKGARYTAEVNGTRESGWGVGQNNDFQQTAPYLALRSDLPLRQAIEQARHGHAKGRDADPRQLAYWMRELTEVTLLDYIFSQQDRIGNIDYRWYWYWADGGQIKRRLAHGPRPPAELAAHKPVRLKRTWLNDNDAGGRVAYANFAKKTRMLEKQRHYHPDTYRRLMALDRDFGTNGERYAYVRDSFGLSPRQLKQVVQNTHQAAAILRGSCEAGKLRFDLDPDAFFLDGRVTAAEVACAG